MNKSLPKKVLSVQNPKSIVGSWIFTVLWCGISFTVFWAFAIQAREIGGGIVGGLFSLIGLVMLFATARMTLEYSKYGQVHLSLEGEPPAAGRSFSAKLDLPTDAAVAGNVSAELACVRVTWSRGSKGGPSKSEQDAWTRKQEFPVRRGATSGYSTLRLDVPADQPASDLPGGDPPDAMLEVGHPAGIEIGRSYYRWELRVKMDVPGIDLDRTFKLQVAPAQQAAGARPEVAQGTAPRINPALSAGIEQRIAARRVAEQNLSALCAFVGIAPFLVPFTVAGLAVGLAGCPMSWYTNQPPSCEFAGINWGPLMAGAFDLMFFAVPAGIAGSVLLYMAGQMWLNRSEPRQSATFALGVIGPLIGLAMLGGFLYKGGFLDGPLRRITDGTDVQQPAKAGKDASSVGRVDQGRAPAPNPRLDANEEDRLKNSLASIERDRVTDHPSTGLTLYQLSLIYERQKKANEQERALLAALEILEKRPAAEVRQTLGTEGGWVDKEIVARRLGDFYWDQRRYDRGFEYYDRAYRYAPEIQTSEDSRNTRLARDSAGRMVTACMLGKWEIADSAMKELKERIVRTDAETRKQLDYWIRTGEPRLAARKC